MASGSLFYKSKEQIQIIRELNVTHRMKNVPLDDDELPPIAEPDQEESGDELDIEDDDDSKW